MTAPHELSDSELLHRLWTAATRQPDYDKALWMEMESRFMRRDAKARVRSENARLLSLAVKHAADLAHTLNQMEY